ncbi:28S ribosomal protein S29, mitochondrial-like isoform X1 [Stegodyphus dumicola]|uniref:28S ribosomal protein S29, mitochondrial-like isoform X1 n=1 Tax=Stegodyphus dumicola TaxID=202533 RepID=UPI0015AD6DE7|nr:28S ribosomal protein S29, mitochondrial-like isoform X1 [Stegodyphus dumicola]
MNTFGEACIMVREPALEVIAFLKNANYSHPALRFVIYGRNGTGKTTTLMHIVHFGYQAEYLLVHVPWVSNWTKRPKEVVASQFEENRIDLPVESALWLQHFKSQNSDLMQKLDLKTSKSYTWSKREVTEEGKPLMEVVEHGLQRVRHSSDCIAVLLKEIKYHSQFGKFKTLLIVDGVNAIFTKTNVKRPDQSLVPAPEITIVNAVMKMLKNDWTNAAVITSVDVIPFNRNSTMQDPYTPRALLGKEGFELLDPFIPIQTKHYTEKEAESALDYYTNRLWIQSEEARSEDGRKQLKFLSGYNPLILMKICDPI